MVTRGELRPEAKVILETQQQRFCFSNHGGDQNKKVSRDLKRLNEDQDLKTKLGVKLQIERDVESVILKEGISKGILEEKK